MKSRRNILLGAAAVLVLTAMIAAGCLHAASVEERECQRHHRDDFARGLGESVHRGDSRTQVLRFLTSDDWDLTEDVPRPHEVLAGKFTYCGLGSSRRIDATFRFDERDRLASYELDDGTAPALRVDR